MLAITPTYTAHVPPTRPRRRQHSPSFSLVVLENTHHPKLSASHSMDALRTRSPVPPDAHRDLQFKQPSYTLHKRFHSSYLLGAQSAPRSAPLILHSDHLPLFTNTTAMPFLPSDFPPTPAASIHSPTKEPGSRMPSGSSFKAFERVGSSSAIPLDSHLPPTPVSFQKPYSPITHDSPHVQDAIRPNEHGYPRSRSGRRPMSAYPMPSDGIPFLPPRKYTDPIPRTLHYPENDDSDESRQELHVDLDAYSTTDYDPEEIGLDSRAPTLSFVTTSTLETDTSTPPMGIQYGFRHDVLDDKPETNEPRIRVRTTTGRSNAYDSAESSMASGAYSVLGYPDHSMYSSHPHPPPIPTLPGAFANTSEQVGLGITAHDIVLSSPARRESPSSQHVRDSPSSSFAHRPWRSDVVGHLRTESGSSSITSTSTDDEDLSQSRSGPSNIRGSHSPSAFMSYPYPGYNADARLPWEIELSEDRAEAKALTMVMEGKEKMFDKDKLEQMGGIDALSETVLESLAGITHLILPGLGSSLLPILPSLLLVLAPSLVVLDISDNDLSFIPDSLRQCGHLEELNISENPIRQIPNWLSELSTLRVLAVDRCGLPGLPNDLSRLTSLHTICMRGNKLVSLPPWLCQLHQLQTLRVDDNPFAPEWSLIVSPILLRPLIASRTHRVNGSTDLREAPSLASITSSLTSTSLASNDARGDSWLSASSSTNHSMRGISTLNSIAEDHQPYSAPVQEPEQSRESTITKGLRKMRSTGALLDQRLLSSTAVAEATSSSSSRDLRMESMSGPSLAPPTAQRYASLGNAEGKRAASVVGSPHNAEMSSAPSSRVSSGTSTPNGPGKKWGFLRKMSMNRLKGDKVTLSSSANTNIKLMPPPIHHQHSAPPNTLPRRPSVLQSHSAMTLPTQKLFSSDLGEFGQTPIQPPSSTLPISPTNTTQPLLSTTQASTSLRGKRRSFLPVDEAPSINISIPATSPFMPNNAVFSAPSEGLPPAQSEDTIADETMTASGLFVDSPINLEDSQVRYTTGLESIKSYLRDLYDLSRPPIEPYGGFEVLPGTDGFSGATTSSEQPSSPTSFTRNSVSEARRARGPTMESQLSRNPSTASVKTSERSCAVEVESGKKFKNDRAKRARVIREIYETERTYVRGLGELVSIYVKPAAQPVKPGSSETIIPAAERKIVFGGVESILTIHRDNLLNALENAVKPLLESTDDEEGKLSTATAHAVGEVFRTYIAYMKQYSSYINNFDNALSRMKTWTSIAGPIAPGLSSRSTSNIGAAAASVGMMSAHSLPLGDSASQAGGTMNTSQKKRVKAFLKRCREHPKHSQINLDSYLLLPIQRVPRYKLLLEDLAMCTPPRTDETRDTLDDALNEIAGLASMMNEEKRDAESRLRLYQWQQRITSRGPSPLVQPHRKLILDGALHLIRLVKKAASYVEVDNTVILDGDHTIMPSKTVVPVEYINPEPMNKQMMLILCTDMMVLVSKAHQADGWDGQVDLFNVLRMATVREPASIVNGNVLRVVDNKSIYYFNAESNESILNWCRAINTARKR